jgi:hypothetical protein
MGNHDKGNDNDLPVYTPYLNIRYDTADMGWRPLAPGTVFWASPDIVATPTDIYGNVEAGTNVTVRAHVLNWGMSAAVGVNVEFYWLNPSLAIIPTNANLIGSKLVSVPAMNYVDVTCPVLWTPQFVNGGHECLIVQCSCPQDPIIHPLLPMLDRHVGQRNIMIANPEMKQKLQLFAANPFHAALPFTLMLSTLSVQSQPGELKKIDKHGFISLLSNLNSHQRSFTSAEKLLRLRVQDVTQKDEGVRLEGMKRSDAPRPEKPLDFNSYTRERAKRDPDFNSGMLGKIVGNFDLSPWMLQVIEIETSPKKLKVGQFIVHRFTQVAGGYDIGGYTIIVPPERWD